MGEVIWLRGEEYKSVSCPPDFGDRLREILKRENTSEIARLGLYSSESRFMVAHFVGHVWLEEGKFALRVVPKTNGHGQQVSYLQMFIECFNDPHVSQHMQSFFQFWPDQKPIPVDGSRADITLLLIAIYLKQLNELCCGHIRRGFTRLQENLTGRLKGRILVGENLRKNLAYGRLDRVCCQFQIHSLDTTENQILRTALEQSIRFLRRTSQTFPLLSTWSRVASAALADVRLRRIDLDDFQGIRYSGLMKKYKEPHKLAKAILFLLGSDPGSEIKKKQTVLPPFAIDMNELFERYCEVLLRMKDSWRKILWVGYNNANCNLGKECSVRPDFIMKGTFQAVIDAKYKYAWGKPSIDCKQDSEEESTVRKDLSQLMLYSRHSYVQEKAGGAVRMACILYPKVTDENGSWVIESLTSEASRIFKEDFEIPIYRVPVPLPLRHTSIRSD